MAVTQISDIINPEVLGDQVSAKFPDMLVLGNSSLVEVDTEFPLGSPGTQFKMPFWKRIGAFGSMTEGAALTPGKITADAEFAIVQRAGAAYEVYDTAALVSKSDPVGEVADQIARRAAEFVDNAIVVTGCDATPNVSDASTGTITVNTVIAALLKLGDNYSKLLAGGALIMHSKVYGDLVQLGVIQNQYQSGMDFLKTGVVPTLLGLPIMISDRVTQVTVSSVVHYNTYIVGPGALALFYQRAVRVEFDRDILYQADIIAATVHFAPHLFGWDDVSNTQKAEQAKSIHVVKLITQ
jgi:hypothetical protein